MGSVRVKHGAISHPICELFSGVSAAGGPTEQPRAGGCGRTGRVRGRLRADRPGARAVAEGAGIDLLNNLVSRLVT